LTLPWNYPGTGWRDDGEDDWIRGETYYKLGSTKNSEKSIMWLVSRSYRPSGKILPLSSFYDNIILKILSGFLTPADKKGEVLLQAEKLHRYLREFTLEENKRVLLEKKSPLTRIEEFSPGDEGDKIPVFINEFWTSRQRQAARLHEIAYRACFKPQLPRFFIKLLTNPGNQVFDPFMGRGTTPVEAALLDRRPAGVDINPLSCILTRPRLEIPQPEEVRRRLQKISLDEEARAEINLSMFYHTRTEGELVSLSRYLQERRCSGEEDRLDRWIRMVATNRLTGHSPGFFSVYSLPPNQAVTPERQLLINQKYNQEPEYRDVRALILKKTRHLLSDLDLESISRVNRRGKDSLLCEGDSRSIPSIPPESVQLTVTSPPFLDIVQYAKDNWLRCWFNGMDAREIEKKMTLDRKIGHWSSAMEATFLELYRVTCPGGWVAFEVGEVRRGKEKLEKYVVPAGQAAGFTCQGILINRQNFTKTANIWGVKNNRSGTNSNRVVLFQKS